MGIKAMTSKQRTELRGVGYWNRKGVWYMPSSIGGYSACSALERRGLVKSDVAIHEDTGREGLAYWLTDAGEVEVLRTESEA
jgi:DNA-binding PadR family transcriptional regulator